MGIFHTLVAFCSATTLASTYRNASTTDALSRDLAPADVAITSFQFFDLNLPTSTYHSAVSTTALVTPTATLSNTNVSVAYANFTRAIDTHQITTSTTMSNTPLRSLLQPRYCNNTPKTFTTWTSTLRKAFRPVPNLFASPTHVPGCPTFFGGHGPVVLCDTPEQLRCYPSCAQELAQSRENKDVLFWSDPHEPHKENGSRSPLLVPSDTLADSPSRSLESSTRGALPVMARFGLRGSLRWHSNTPWGTTRAKPTYTSQVSEMGEHMIDKP